jgi:hypothetical protein
MLPEIDQSRLDPRAEARFKTLQQAVRTLTSVSTFFFTSLISLLLLSCVHPFSSLLFLIPFAYHSFLSFLIPLIFSSTLLPTPHLSTPHLSYPLLSYPLLPLNPQVTLVRVARERRHIRNNLPLRGVLVIAANKDDIEALEYLKGENYVWCGVVWCEVLCDLMRFNLSR